VYEGGSGRIVGGQVVCRTAAALRVNILSVVVERGMSVYDLSVSDFCYSPPCADVWAPEAVCATAALRRLEAQK